MGVRAVPALRTRLVPGGTLDAMRAAVQLAGAIRSRDLIDPLQTILCGDDPTLCAEAAESLARVGGPQASAALAEALTSSLGGVAPAAARGLGLLALRGDVMSSDSQTVQLALLAALERARSSCDLSLAREVMRALVRMQVTDAVPALESLLDRAPLWRRGNHRSLQRLAIEALCRLPGREAERVLEATARRGDRRLRALARKRLAEYAPSSALGGAGESLH